MRNWVSFNVMQKSHKVVIVVFMSICVLMAFLTFFYYKSLQKAVIGEGKDYFLEVSNRIGINAGRAIEDNFAVLGTLSSVFSDEGVSSFNNLQSLVLAQQEHWNYENIVFIDKDANVYDIYGRRVSMSNKETLKSSIDKRERDMELTSVNNGEPLILFTIPLEEKILLDGIQICALGASYNTSMFEEMIALTAFGESGYASINKNDGSVVFRKGLSVSDTSNNTYEILRTAKLDKGSNFQNVKHDLDGNRAGIIQLEVEDRPLYMVYTPFPKSTWCLLTFAPVELVNGKSEGILEVTLFLCSVIAIVFSVLFGILLFSLYRHRRNLEKIAYVDPVSGGNTSQKFFELTKQSLKEKPLGSYAMIYINIDKFKILNEQYGRPACDSLLKSINGGIESDLGQGEHIGRIFADNFLALVICRGEEDLLGRLRKWYAQIEEYQGGISNLWVSPVLEFGIYVIEEEIPSEQMADRAKLALRESEKKLESRIRYAIYDDSIRSRILRENHLSDRMEAALNNNEFEVYLQPKYCLSTNKFDGAEALVRWNSKEEGLIYPSEFITLFEKNGFIITLNRFVFEQVCIALNRWKNKGLELMKVSVNCSGNHLKDTSFLKEYLKICGEWDIPASCIELELEENVVFEDVEGFSKLVEEIHKAGFGCSMDNFGKEYSSLNILNDISIDTIKLDAVFFKNGEEVCGRRRHVIVCILEMARALGINTVAEGIEEAQQVEMLRDLDCGYVQGYYFSKPVPIADFEALVFKI